MVGEMTEEMVVERIEGFFVCKHHLIYEEVQFFVAAVLGLVNGHDDWLFVEGRPNLLRILLRQSELANKEPRQIITWEYDYHPGNVDGLIYKQSFIAKPSDPWIEQIDYFSSIGSGEMLVGVVPIIVNLKHRRMQKVMQDVWNMHLVNRARAEALTVEGP